MQRANAGVLAPKIGGTGWIGRYWLKRHRLPALFALLLSLLCPPLASAATEPCAAPTVQRGIYFCLKLPDAATCDSVAPYAKASLLLNGIDAGVHPLGCDPARKEVSFQLEPEMAKDIPAAKALWQGILAKPWRTETTNNTRTLHYTLLPAQPTTALPFVATGDLHYRLFDKAWAGIGAVLVLAIWGGLWVAASKSGMLRDAGNPGTTLADRPWSLARVQMAWWFALIIGAYVFLWVMAGDVPVLSGTVLSLAGLSGAAGLASAGLDDGKKTAFPVSSGSFLRDILTDADGITLPRFQMLAMTVVLGVMFLAQLASTLTLPDFDTSTLALMGISAGTYLGFKVPEKHV